MVAQCPLDALQATNQANSCLDLITTMNTANSLPVRSSKYDFNVLNEHAKRGSQTAEKMCNALRHFQKALNVLMQSEMLTEQQEHEFIHEFSQCCLIEHIVAEIPHMKMERQIHGVVDRVLQRCGSESNRVTSQLDEDVRTCYVVLHMGSPKSVLRFLRPCKQKHSKSVFFLEFSAAGNCLSGQLEAALYDANAGLEIDPDHCQFLFTKATLLNMLERNVAEIIEAFRAFLAVAPKDHSQVPESYYAMSNCLLIHCEDVDTMNTMNMIKETYEQGEEAEKMQLPCFLPYTFETKMLVKSALDVIYPPDAIPALAPDRKSHLTDLHRIEIF